MSSSLLSHEALRIAATIPACIAFTLTVFRLVQRALYHGFWWDDFWAGVALVNGILHFAGIWIRSEDTVIFSQREKIALFWMTTITFPLSVWCSRISIACSIARILPSDPRRRRLVVLLVTFCALCCTGLLLHRIIVCTTKTAWHIGSDVQCRLGSAVAYASICMDVTADVLLVVFPLQLLWKMKLARKQRLFALAIFSASFITTLSAIVYAVFVLKTPTFGSSRGNMMGLATELESSVSLIVCNFVVVVSFMYRLFLSRQQSNEADQDSGEWTETKAWTAGVLSEPRSANPGQTFETGTPYSNLTFTQLSLTQFTSTPSISLGDTPTILRSAGLETINPNTSKEPPDLRTQ
ncbi:hypothetical protein DL96DRAFT_1820385 [Flagelloscypha sp. PMI_526]|nr:hypothetical protein DL96DRAFT_1820385 [Flagelloscypha sp. PMI_526]